MLVNITEVPVRQLQNKRIHTVVVLRGYYEYPVFVEVTGKVSTTNGEDSVFVGTVTEMKSELESSDHAYYKDCGLWLHRNDMLFLDVL